MKQLRYILLTAFITMGIFSSVLYISCNKSKCGSTTCSNGGTCSNDVCICPMGYSGTSCATGWSDASIGTYNVYRSNCNPAVAGISQWVSSVVKDATNGGFTIDISNFDNSNITIIASIDSLQNIRITPASGSYGVSATGTYANDTIHLNFTTTTVSGGGGYSCKMTFAKQH